MRARINERVQQVFNNALTSSSIELPSPRPGYLHEIERIIITGVNITKIDVEVAIGNHIVGLGVNNNEYLFEFTTPKQQLGIEAIIVRATNGFFNAPTPWTLIMEIFGERKLA